jgi:uncharacterized protein
LPCRTALRLAKVVVAGFIAVFCAFAALAAEPKFPPLTGQIMDEAGLLSPADRQEIAEMLKALEAKSTDQIVVYTTRSLQGYEIEDFGYRLGRFWGIGQKGVNNGILLIVAPNERTVRIEVGYGLEPIMTDLLSGLIIRNVILPAFRRGDFAVGIKAGVRDIRDALLGDAEEVRKRAEAGRNRSTGQAGSDLWLLLLIIAVVLIVLWVSHSDTRNLPPGPRYRDDRQARDRARRPSSWGHGGSSGGWGGGFGGGSSGGGGWSGGGGTFGGGGATGRW